MSAALGPETRPGRFGYASLLASLPRLDPPFRPRRVDTPELRLDRRLAGLAPADAERLHVIEAGIDPRRLGGLTRSELLMRIAAARAAAPDGPARAAVTGVWRRRALAHAVANPAAIPAARAVLGVLGEPGPSHQVQVSDGRFSPTGSNSHRAARRLAHRAAEAGFGLERFEPWLAGASDLAPAELDRRLLEADWADLKRLSPAPRFDFTGVVLYVLAWLTVRQAVARGDAAARLADRVAAAAAPGLAALREASR